MINADTKTSSNYLADEMEKQNCIFNNIMVQDICSKDEQFLVINNYHFCYLLQEREFVKTKENVFKPGKTKKGDASRFNNYPKDSILILLIRVYDCDVAEKEILQEFNKKFKQRLDIGREYFEGDIDDIKNEFINIISKKYVMCFEPKNNKIDNKYKSIILENEKTIKKQNKIIGEKENIIKKQMSIIENLTKKLNNNQIINKGDDAENINKKPKCLVCGITFAFQSELSRHKKLCKGVVVSENNSADNNDILKEVLELLKANSKVSIDVSKALVNVTEASVNATEANVVNVKTTKKSVNIMTFAMSHFKTAPSLKKLEKNEIANSIEFFKTDLKKLEYDNSNNKDSDTDSDEDNDVVDIKTEKRVGIYSLYDTETIMEYGEIIINHYCNKNLKCFIGEVAKHCRKKKNPNDNQFWETDSQILHFIIKYAGTKHNNSIWIKDESGSIIKNVVIVNLCIDIKNIMLRFFDELTKNDKDNMNNPNVDLLMVMKKKDYAIKIARNMLKDSFYEKVLKYIAPSFRFNDTMMEHYSVNNDIDKEKDKNNNDVYKIFSDIYKNTDYRVYDNDFVLLYFKGQELVVSAILRYKSAVLCIYYKYHNNQITEQEVVDIKKASCNFFGNDADIQFSYKMFKAIPLVVHNNQFTENELLLLAKHKVKHTMLTKKSIVPYVYDLFEEEFGEDFDMHTNTSSNIKKNAKR